MKGAGSPQPTRMTSGSPSARLITVDALIPPKTAVDDQIDLMLEQLAHFVRIAQRIGVAGHDQGHAHQWLAEFFQQCQGNRMAWHTQADGAFF